MLDYNLLEKFVINLKRRPDRLKRFQDSCPLNDVNVVYGFDARYESNDLVKKFKNLMPGEVGCFISHIQIFKQIIDKNIPFSLIMEDDAVFCNDFYKRCSKVLSEVTHDTDILYIGGRFDPEFRMKNCLHVSDLIVKHNFPNKTWPSECNPDGDRTTHAYIVSYKLAKILLDAFHSQNIVHCPIDSWLIHTFIGKSVPIYNAQPLLCHSPLIGDSDIRGPSCILSKIK